MTCGQSHRDGSYVLGALSPAERQQFEQHLAGCAECSQSVRELAGLPGLLARVDPEILKSPPVKEPVPDTLLPALVRQVRRNKRRRTLVTSGLAAAAAVTVIVVSLAVTNALSGDGTSTPAAPQPTTDVAVPTGRTMVPVGQAPVRATLAFESVAWGTRLDLTCTYFTPAAHEYGPPRAVEYAMFVRTRDGRTEQVATWRALPGKTMQLTAATAAGRDNIASVEVRTARGTPVLRLTA